MYSQVYKLKMAGTPGLKVSLELAGLEDKAPTVIIGGLPGKYIMLRHPVVLPNDKSLWNEYLYSGNSATVRYIFDGAASGFKTEIVKQINSPDKIIFLKYPKRIETYNLRRHKRVSCYLDATVNYNSFDIHAMIEDLSTSGCALSYLIKNDTPVPDIGDKINLSCPYFTEEFKTFLKCKVQRTTKDTHKINLGLTFNKPEPELLIKIQDYITNVIQLTQ